jgi:hypothetical protein
MTDLIALAFATRMEAPRLTRPETQRRWKANNRAAFNAYRRNWRQKRREQGLPVT